MAEQPPRIPPADSAFFQEWNARRPGQTRSIARARALIEQLGLSRPAAATLVVVGSKGKGTTAIYASAYLAAAGLRTVTVTSPSLLDTTERIRTDGIAIAEHELIRLGESLSSASAPPPGYPADPSTDGYLSPGGLFTIAGLLHAAEIGAQAIVIEAGRGGSSDEVSLIPADVVAIAPIFSEHLAELGGTLVAIAQDKCGVIGQATAAVVSAPQSREVLASIQTAVTRRCHGRCQLDLVGEAAVAEVSSHLLPAGIGRDNALLGCLAARHLAAPHPVASTRTERPSRAALDQTLGSVSLPGRLSLHQVRGTETNVLIDAAINRAGYVAALAEAQRHWGAVDHVLLSLPDDKDHAGAVEVLSGLPVTFVSLTTTHLPYTRTVPAGWRRVCGTEVDGAFISTLGQHVLALGTISFVALMLRTVGASNAVAFEAPLR